MAGAGWLMVCGVQVTVEEFKKAAMKLMIGAPRDPKDWSFDKCVEGGVSPG